MPGWRVEAWYVGDVCMGCRVVKGQPPALQVALRGEFSIDGDGSFNKAFTRATAYRDLLNA